MGKRRRRDTAAAKTGNAGSGTGKGHACRACRATLELSFGTMERARQVDDATRGDNEGFVLTRTRGDRLVATAGAESISSLIHTLDDYLECVSVAERIITQQGIGRRRRGKNECAPSKMRGRV